MVGVHWSRNSDFLMVFEPVQDKNLGLKCVQQQLKEARKFSISRVFNRNAYTRGPKVSSCCVYVLLSVSLYTVGFVSWSSDFFADQTFYAALKKNISYLMLRQRGEQGDFQPYVVFFLLSL